MRVFVPSRLAESVSVEHLQPVQFLANVNGLPEIDYMFAHAWSHLDGAVCQHVELFYLVLPELVGEDGVAHFGKHLACVAAVDVGDDDV